MKRRSFALVLLLAALVAPAPIAQGQGRGEAKVTLAGKSITIDYGRPSLKGRDMLGQLQAGQTWRMGSDADTTLNSEADLAFGGAALPKGAYILQAKRSADNKWMLLATQDGRVVAEAPLAEQKLTQAVEVFTIELSGQGNKGQFAMKWGVTALTTSFTAK